MKTDQGVKTEVSPVWCDSCDKQGEIVLGSFEESAFVICEVCGYETAEVWCPNCEMGGQYIRNVEDRPRSWSCPECKTRYELPKDFYEYPVSMRILDSSTLPIKVAKKQRVMALGFIMLLIISFLSYLYFKLSKLGVSTVIILVIMAVAATFYIILYVVSSIRFQNNKD